MIYAHTARPSSDIGLYLTSARFGADANGNTPEQTEIVTIADFDRFIAERRPAFVLIQFYGYPRRPMYDLVKARTLVAKLLRAELARQSREDNRDTRNV